MRNTAVAAVVEYLSGWSFRIRSEVSPSQLTIIGEVSRWWMSPRPPTAKEVPRPCRGRRPLCRTRPHRPGYARS